MGDPASERACALFIEQFESLLLPILRLNTGGVIDEGLTQDKDFNVRFSVILADSKKGEVLLYGADVVFHPGNDLQESIALVHGLLQDSEEHRDRREEVEWRMRIVFGEKKMFPEAGGDILVVVKEAGKPAEVRHVENSLKSFQKIVGGDIELLSCGEFDMYLNDMGRFNDLPVNFFLNGSTQHGDVLMSKKNREGKQVSLTPLEADRLVVWLGTLEKEGEEKRISRPPPVVPFDLLRNLLGPLRTKEKARIRAFLANPTQDTWNNAYSLVVCINPHAMFWQAVCRVDPSFPRKLPPTEAPIKGRTWPRIPTKEQAIQALWWAAEPCEEPV